MSNYYNFIDYDPETVYAIMIDSLSAACGEPLYPGDERRIFGEGEAAIFVQLYSQFNDQARQRMLRYARGVVLDYLGEYLGVTRLAASPATATFRFSVSAPQSTNIIIPQGTRITSDGSVYFATDTAAVLQAGADHVDIPATCQTTGAAYNDLTPGSIATLVDLIPYIQDVANITTTTAGDDGEPYTTAGDDRLRNRIRLAPATRTTAGPRASYEYYALSADPDIIDVYIECPEDQPTIVNIYPLMTGGALPDETTLAQVTAACSADDIRPMTDRVTACTPSVVPYSIHIHYYITAENETAAISAIEGAEGAIAQYIDWQQGALGRAINPDKLRSLVLVPGDGLTGADRLDLTAPAYTPLAANQVAQFDGTLTITHEVI